MSYPCSLRDRVRFTEGDCHVLAKRIARITGWPLMCIEDADGGPDIHAFVLTPCGRALDIEGLQDLNTFCKKWRHWTQPVGVPGRPIATSWREMVSIGWPSYAVSRYSYARARVMADRLLDFYADELGLDRSTARV